jgi:hypothetical protein
MNYYRCKCGRMESWSSYGPARCLLCTKCNTTLADSPEGHLTEPEPHRWTPWQWTIDPQTGVREQERTCNACHLEEKRDEATALSDTPAPDGATSRR